MQVELAFTSGDDEFEKWVNSSLHPFDFPDNFLIYYLTIF